MSEERGGGAGDGGGHADQGPVGPSRPIGFRGLGIGLAVAVLLAAITAGLLYGRHHQRLAVDAQRRQHEVDRGPRVFVTEVRVQPGGRELTLPADVRGFFQSTVYAKIAGYVKSILVDKGDAVTRGQILAVLASPEVDQQVAAAKADLAIKKRTFERYRELVKRDFVSLQDFETVRSFYEVAQATLRQMRALQAYQVLRAPFAGTVTARYVDPGALVPAATGSTQSALPLVDIADLRRLRVTVFVQQDAAPFLRVGDPATIRVDQRPDLEITATVTRFAKALDPRSRTMLCEIWLDNRYRLYPGTFVHVTLRLEAQALPVVPSAALLLHDQKPSLAVIRDSRVHFVPVRTGVDDGRTVQIVEGIQAGARVALNLPPEIAEGALVRPAIETPQAGQAPPGAPQPQGERKGSSRP